MSLYSLIAIANLVSLAFARRGDRLLLQSWQGNQYDEPYKRNDGLPPCRSCGPYRNGPESNRDVKYVPLGYGATYSMRMRKSYDTHGDVDNDYYPSKNDHKYPNQRPRHMRPPSSRAYKTTEQPSKWTSTTRYIQTLSPAPQDLTNFPTVEPTEHPITVKPSKYPTLEPTSDPIKIPETSHPTIEPTVHPTSYPTEAPTAMHPSVYPTTATTTYPAPGYKSPSMPKHKHRDYPSRQNREYYEEPSKWMNKNPESWSWRRSLVEVSTDRWYGSQVGEYRDSNYLHFDDNDYIYKICIWSSELVTALEFWSRNEQTKTRYRVTPKWGGSGGVRNCYEVPQNSCFNMMRMFTDGERINGLQVCYRAAGWDANNWDNTQYCSAIYGSEVGELKTDHIPRYRWSNLGTTTCLKNVELYFSGKGANDGINGLKFHYHSEVDDLLD